jgi:hypothetical protein
MSALAQTRVFISGVFRSGTSLLTRALNAHAEIKAAYQPFTAVFKRWRDCFCDQQVESRFDRDLPMGMEYFPTADFLEWFARDALRLGLDKGDLNDLKRLLRDSLSSADSELPPQVAPHIDALAAGTFADLLDQLFGIIDRCLPQKRARVLGIKEVWCEEFFQPLLSQDRYRVLHIFRDPRAVLASRNSGRYLQSRGGMKYPLLFVAHTWRRSLSFLDRHQGHPRYWHLRYEDLVSDPVASMNAICRFLEVDDDPAMVNPACYTTIGGAPWNPNSTFASARAFNVASIDYWRRSLAAEEIGLLEFLLQREMRTLGYSPTQPLFGLEDFLAYQEDTSAITKWLRCPPFLLSRIQKERELARIKP